MPIIVNYIGWNILKGILLAIILLLGIDLFFYFINELRSIGIGNYSLLKALEFVVLAAPRKLYNIAPWGVLIGSLLSLGSLATSQELLFIRTIGISANRIAFYGSIYVLFFTICVFCIGEFLAPKVEILAQKRKTIALSKGNAIYTASGVWTRVKNKFIHIAKIQDANTLNTITIYSFDNNLNLKKSIFAESAKLIQEKNCVLEVNCHDIWEMQGVIVTNFSDLYNNSGNVSHAPQINTIELSNMPIYDLLDVNVLRASNAKNVSRLSISSLALIIKNRTANNLSVIDYKVAYWKKIIQPFSILVMGYLTVPFVLGPLRSSSKGTRLLIGAVIGVVFYLLDAFLGPLSSVINMSPFIATILPPLTFFSFAVYFSTKV